MDLIDYFSLIGVSCLGRIEKTVFRETFVPDVPGDK